MFPKTGNKLHPTKTGRLSEVEISEVIAATLHLELGPTHRAIKTVMLWTGASERTVKHWFAGTHSPSCEHLISLVRNSDQMLTVFMSMTGRTAQIPESYKLEVRNYLVAALKLLDN